MKIVLYRNIEYDFDAIRIIGPHDDLDFGDDSVQLSEAIEVDFPVLEEVDLVKAKVGAIDKDIQKAKAGIELLEQAKAELLAIPDLREG